MTLLLVLWPAAGVALAAAVLAADRRYQDPRPVCVACDEPRLPKYLADGVCVVCRSPASARAEAPAPVVVELDERRTHRHRAIAAHARRRADLQRQRAGLRTLLADVEDQLRAHTAAVQIVHDDSAPGGTR